MAGFTGHVSQQGYKGDLSVMVSLLSWLQRWLGGTECLLEEQSWFSNSPSAVMILDHRILPKRAKISQKKQSLFF